MPSDDAIYALDLMRQRRDLDLKFTDYRYGDQANDVLFPPKFAATWREILARENFNMAQAVIHAKSDRLNVEAWEGDDRANSLWHDEGASAYQNDVHPDAMTTGDAYLLSWPARTMDGPIRWNPLRSDEAIVIYDDDDPTTVLYGVKMWVVEERGRTRRARVRTNVYHPDRVERYISPLLSSTGLGSVRDRRLDLKQIVDGENLTPFDEDGIDAEFPHPFDGVPLVHFRNGKGRDRRYGRSELADVAALQDKLNHAGIQLYAVTEQYGFPFRVLTGFEYEDWDGDGKPDNLPNVDPRVDRFLAFPGVQTRVEQLDAADLDQLARLVGVYVEQISAVSKVPPHIFLRQSGTVPSGEALRVVEAPLIADVESKQQDFTPSWAEVMRLNGIEAQPRWSQPSQMDDLEQWELVTKKTEVGYPLRQALIETGMEADTVDQVFADAASQDNNVGSMLLRAFRDGRDPVEVVDEVRQ